MYGFDLDGVFVPDLKWDDAKHTHLLYFRHNHIHPIFEPIGEYIIITGRPISDKVETLKWVDAFFTNKPLKIFHENTDFKLAKEYKAKVINQNKNLKAYVESELPQVKYLQENTNIDIIHFSTFIRGLLSEDLFRL